MMPNVITSDELLKKSQHLISEAKTLVGNPEATAEDHGKAKAMLDDAQELKARSATMKQLEGLAAEEGQEQKAKNPPRPGPQHGFKSFGDYLYSIWRTVKFQQWDQRLGGSYITVLDETGAKFDMENPGWVETKDLTEAVGADGGFTVFPEYRSDLFMLSEFQKYVRQRALVLPMRARQVHIPVLDQTGTTQGQSNLYGGVVPSWTEEAAEKDESDPQFRQMIMVANKLVVYTEASDELLADSAIGLETLLTQLFGSAIANEEEWAFINGTGTGQPLGIVHQAAGVTLRPNRIAANAIQIGDIFTMLSQFMGQSPIWLAHQSTMPQILQLNGPAANPSYVWVQSARDGMPASLMGYPIFFIENCPTLGNEGDIILADWSKYVIGDRQVVTIDSSKHFRFRNDLTAWRAVHRVGGRPWLNLPLTLRDGTTQVSPFVILDDATVS